MIKGLFETHLNVRDLERSRRFYSDLLGFISTDEAAGRGRQAQRSEVIAGDEKRRRPLRAAGRADVQRNHPERNQIVERTEALDEVPILGPRRTRAEGGIGDRLDQVEP